MRAARAFRAQGGSDIDVCTDLGSNKFYDEYHTDGVVRYHACESSPVPTP